MKKIKSSKNNNHEEKEEKMEKNGKGVTIAIMVGMPKRGSRTATNKAKKKK